MLRQRVMKSHFVMMAAYNAWANGRLYDAAASLSDEAYRRDCGAFFGSIHRTLNHIYVSDVIWLSRFRGQPNPPWTLDHVVHDDLGHLRRRRDAMDRDIMGFVGSLKADAEAAEITYLRVSDRTQVTQSLVPAIAHLFNHHTHHRGQCHAMLTMIGAKAPSLDLLQFQLEAA